MEFQNLKNDIEGITMGDPVATTVDHSKVGIKKLLDGKINYNSKFNRQSNRNKVNGAQFQTIQPDSTFNASVKIGPGQL